MATNVRKQITEGKTALKEIMQENLATIAESVIQKIMAKAEKLPDAKALDAIKGITFPGFTQYKSTLLTAIAVVAYDGLQGARADVPKKKNIKLSEGEDSIKLAEYDSLPTALQKKIKARAGLLADTHMADLEKAIAFQYLSSIESTDSLATIKKDLLDSADDFIAGASIDAGASVTAADMVNSARKEFFTDSEVAEEIEAFQFLNGDPVSPICQDLAGTVFSKGDPGADRYYPPLHFNCKSFVVPILNGNLGSKEIKDLKPSESSLEKYVQLSEQGCGCGLAHF